MDELAARVSVQSNSHSSHPASVAGPAATSAWSRVVKKRRRASSQGLRRRSGVAASARNISIALRGDSWIRRPCALTGEGPGPGVPTLLFLVSRHRWLPHGVSGLPCLGAPWSGAAATGLPLAALRASACPGLCLPRVAGARWRCRRPTGCRRAPALSGLSAPSPGTGQPGFSLAAQAGRPRHRVWAGRGGSSAQAPARLVAHRDLYSGDLASAGLSGAQYVGGNYAGSVVTRLVAPPRDWFSSAARGNLLTRCCAGSILATAWSGLRRPAGWSASVARFEDS